MPQVTIEHAFQIATYHHQAGQIAQAESLYRQILAQQPRHAGALHHLGVIAYQAGRLEVAVDLIRRALVLTPGHAEAYSNLGNALKQQGQLDEAIAVCRQAIALRPNFPDAYNNLANALRDQGKLDQAIAAYHRALALKPSYPEAYSNLGIALRENGQLDRAIAACRQAIALSEQLPDAHFNLGNALRDNAQPADAVIAFSRAIALRANYPEAQNNLGNVLRQTGQLDEAIAAFRQAIVLQPRFPQAYCNLADALRDKGRPDDAVIAARQAITLDPQLAEAYGSLGNALRERGQLDEAIAAYRQAIALNPQFREAHGNLLYTLHFHPGYNADAIAEEHRVWSRQHVEPLKRFIQPHANNRDPERPLRIGYVSPDFLAHAESYYVVPLLEAHDHQRFEVHCYASVLRPDAITRRLRGCADAWHDVLGLSDADVARQIRRDGIDILIDLTMHMSRNRLLCFARKPAPVQVTWLAYPGSTGLCSIDYRITDAHMDPPGLFDAFYTEISVRLADCSCCYNPLIHAEARPARQPGPIRFGSLNNSCKLNPPVLRRWARTVDAVADSRLLLLVDSQDQRARICRLFDEAGVSSGRIVFLSRRSSRMDYLRLYDQFDIALDPLPYNGITTTNDALWMGVPVITLCGHTAVGRAAQGILSALGLPELVAHSDEQYVQIATDLAHDLPRLVNLHSTLRRRMEQSPLMDAPRFARTVEVAYREMWRNWCASPADVC